MKPILFFVIVGVFVGIIYWVLSSAHLIYTDSTGLHVDFMKNSSYKKASDALDLRSNEIQQIDTAGTIKTKIAALPESVKGGLFNVACLTEKSCSQVVSDSDKKTCFDSCRKTTRVEHETISTADAAAHEYSYIKEYLTYYEGTDMKELEGYAKTSALVSYYQIACSRLAAQGAVAIQEHKDISSLKSELERFVADEDVWNSNAEAANACAFAKYILNNIKGNSAGVTIAAPPCDEACAKDNSVGIYESVIDAQNSFMRQLSQKLIGPSQQTNLYDVAYSFEYAFSKNNNMNMAFYGCEQTLKNDGKPFCIQDQKYLGRAGVWKNGMGADASPALFAGIFLADSNNVLGYRDAGDSPVARYYAYENKKLENHTLYLPPAYNEQTNQWEYTPLSSAPPFSPLESIINVPPEATHEIAVSHLLINSTKVLGHTIAYTSLK